MWTYRFQIMLPFPPIQQGTFTATFQHFTQKEKVIPSSIIDVANFCHPCLLTQLIKYVWMDGVYLIALNYRYNFASLILTIDTDIEVQAQEIMSIISISILLQQKG